MVAATDQKVYVPFILQSVTATTPVATARPAGEWYNGDDVQLYPSAITATEDITNAYTIADGSPSLSWHAGAGASVTSDLQWPDPTNAVSVALRKLRITWPDAASYRFAVDVSNDQKNWARVLTATSKAVRPSFDEFTFAETTGRYVRITNLGTKQIVISEVEFWGSVDQGKTALVHPGHTINAAQVKLIRERVKQGLNPWKAAFDKQMSSAGTSLPFDGAWASKTYQPSPKATLELWVADGISDDHKLFVEGDASAAYIQAVAYIVTEDPAYAENVMKILEAWADTLKELKGDNVYVESGWGISSMSHAAELVKNTYPNWDSAIERKFNNMVDTIFMPVIESRVSTAPINEVQARNGTNRVLSMTEARVSMAIFRDDRYQMNRALEYYRRYVAVVVQPSGIHSETCRDMQHAQFALGSLVQIAEIAWKQGVDLYSYLDNRVLKTIEYHANIVYGGTPNPDPGCTLTNIGGSTYIGKPQGVSAFGYEIAYNHYVNRKKLSMPYTKKLIDYGRPDGYIFHWGFATLTHSDAGDPR